METNFFTNMIDTPLLPKDFSFNINNAAIDKWQPIAADSSPRLHFRAALCPPSRAQKRNYALAEHENANATAAVAAAAAAAAAAVAAAVGIGASSAVCRCEQRAPHRAAPLAFVHTSHCRHPVGRQRPPTDANGRQQTPTEIASLRLHT